MQNLSQLRRIKIEKKNKKKNNLNVKCRGNNPQSKLIQEIILKYLIQICRLHSSGNVVDDVIQIGVAINCRHGDNFNQTLLVGFRRQEYGAGIVHAHVGVNHEFPGHCTCFGKCKLAHHL